MENPSSRRHRTNQDADSLRNGSHGLSTELFRFPAQVPDANMAFQFAQHLQGLDNGYGEDDDVFPVAPCDECLIGPALPV